ncbi:hypothetical protein KR100_13065 [Synechococcus sp. KORDI-100]|nr:hypothetical protein KR100_13065 [Synechococcus sp. KORDI-100]
MEIQGVEIYPEPFTYLILKKMAKFLKEMN